MSSSTEVADRGNVFSTGNPRGKFNIFVGVAVQTLRELFPEKISPIGLDTDQYESTPMELEVLYPWLSVGGVCFFDKHGHWRIARKEGDESCEKLGHWPHLRPIEDSVLVLINTKLYSESGS